MVRSLNKLPHRDGDPGLGLWSYSMQAFSAICMYISRSGKQSLCCSREALRAERALD